MSVEFPKATDRWILEAGPHTGVVVSSRARLARNVSSLPFALRANQEQRQFVADRISQALQDTAAIARYQILNMSEMTDAERCLLRESHLISNEFEKGGTGRQVYLSPEMDASIMVNEEDHLRFSILRSGYRMWEVLEQMTEVEAAIEQKLDFAFSEEFGYLTACPTNTGTGLRLSVMLHLPALVMTGQIEHALEELNTFGVVVRGSYGEHSETMGDLFQISNEVTLGKSETQLLELLDHLVTQIIEQERQARQLLMNEAFQKIEDAVFRALGVLKMARQMDSKEAVQLLSRLRLGIEGGWDMPVTHEQLNRLFVDIQPAHLQHFQKAEANANARDIARASLLRATFRNGSDATRN